MARLYEPGEAESGCPGEDNCETFQSSAEDSPVRCPSCPKRQRESGTGVSPVGNADRRQDADATLESGTGVPPVGNAEHRQDADATPETFIEKLLLDRVERFARERDSGRAVYDLLEPLEWELIIIRDETIEAYNRGNQLRMAAALEFICAGMQRA